MYHFEENVGNAVWLAFKIKSAHYCRETISANAEY